MYIHEAVTEARKAPSIIRRPCFGVVFILVPPNPRDLLYLGTERSPQTIIGWEPSVEDVLANDWEVTRAEGIEWPELPPTPAQRCWRRLLKKWLG